MKQGWEKILLKDACKIFTDGDWIESKDQSSEGIRLVQTGNIGFGYFKDKEDKSRFISEETFERLNCTEILAGDLLVSRLPDPVGKSCIIPEINSKMITGVDCTIIRPKDNISSEFLCYYQMSNQYLNDVQSAVSGATRQRISRKNLGLIEIPLPPLPEQQRIVAILDEAFATIAKAKTNAVQNLKNAAALFESYLQGVFENKGDSWEETTLGDVCEFRNGAAHEQHIDEDGMYILVNSKHISSDGEKGKRTNSALSPLYVGDIAFVMSDVPNGKALAKCFLVDKNDTYTLNQRIGAIRSKVFDNDFLVYQFNRHKYLLSFNNGENQTNLRKNDILNCPLYLPSLKQQQTIVQKLDALSAETKKLEAIYQSKINDLDELKKSVLQKAFAGQLIIDNEQ
jgi:type I restriction enzyme S subunit